MLFRVCPYTLTQETDTESEHDAHHVNHTHQRPLAEHTDKELPENMQQRTLFSKLCMTLYSFQTDVKAASRKLLNQGRRCARGMPHKDDNYKASVSVAFVC